MIAALWPPQFLVSFPRISFPETMKFTIKAGFSFVSSRTRAERVITNWRAARHHCYKREALWAQWSESIFFLCKIYWTAISLAIMYEISPTVTYFNCFALRRTNSGHLLRGTFGSTAREQNTVRCRHEEANGRPLGSAFPKWHEGDEPVGSIRADRWVTDQSTLIASKHRATYE